MLWKHVTEYKSSVSERVNNINIKKKKSYIIVKLIKSIQSKVVKIFNKILKKSFEWKNKNICYFGSSR